MYNKMPKSKKYTKIKKHVSKRKSGKQLPIMSKMLKKMDKDVKLYSKEFTKNKKLEDINKKYTLSHMIEKLPNVLVQNILMKYLGNMEATCTNCKNTVNMFDVPMCISMYNTGVCNCGGRCDTITDNYTFLCDKCRDKQYSNLYEMDDYVDRDW